MGFWTVNILLRRCAGSTPRKSSSGGVGGDKLSDGARQTPGHLSCLVLRRAHNAGPATSVPPRTIQVPEPGLDLGGACSPGPASACSRQSNLEPEQCRQGKHTRCEWGQTQCGRDTASARQCYWFAVSLPPQSTTEQVSLKKCPRPPPCIRAEIRH